MEANDQVAAFWNDLKVSIKKDRNHFFGTVILKRTDDEDMFEILDGQQRLSIVTILLAVIRDKLYDIGDVARSTVIQNSISILTDEKTLQPVDRLKLNLRNREFFSDYIQRHKSDKNRKSFDGVKLERTNKLIQDAYEYFEKEINQETEKMNKDEKIEHLTDLSCHVKKRFGLIKTAVKTTAEAYTLFMPLNFRGLELSVADLFKNHIIGEAPKEKRDDAIKIWNDIASILDDAGVVNFLRHFWLSKIDNVGESELYDVFLQYMEEKKMDVITFVKELRDEAEIYSSLYNPNSDYWKGKNEIRELLEDVRTLNIKHAFPLLLAGKNKFSDRDFAKLVDSCIKFSFRFITIGGLNSKNLERLYSAIAIDVRNNKIKDIKSIIEQLKMTF